MSLSNISGDVCFDFHKHLWKSYEIQKLIIETNIIKNYGFLKKYVKLHKWIVEEYPETDMSNELGFFESIQDPLSLQDIDILLICSEGDMNMVKKVFTEKNINSKKMNSNVVTPLSAAAVGRKKEVVKYLISIGADITTKTIVGLTCLDFGDNVWKDYDIQKAVIEKNPKWIHEFSKHKITLHPKIKQEYPEESISDELGFFESKTQIEFYYHDYDGKNKLIFGSDIGDLEIVKNALFDGSDIETINSNQQTPLIIASLRNHFNIIKYLISQGANINAKDYWDNTPLMYSFIYNRINIIKYLISHGADITIRNYDGEICLDKRYKNIWEKYSIQKEFIKRDINNIHLLSQYNITLHPKIKQEYPEESLSDELGFFN